MQDPCLCEAGLAKPCPGCLAHLHLRVLARPEMDVPDHENCKEARHSMAKSPWRHLTLGCERLHVLCVLEQSCTPEHRNIIANEHILSGPAHKRAEVTYETFAARSNEKGFNETKAGITNRLARERLPPRSF